MKSQGRHYTHFWDNKCQKHSENRTLNPQKKSNRSPVAEVGLTLGLGKKDKETDKTTFQYNSHVTLTGIPLAAYAERVASFAENG